MNATHADLTPGERHDITVEFVTRRTVDAEGARVHRLLVDDQRDTRFPVLVDPTVGPPFGLKTGDTYRLSGLLAANALHVPPADAEPDDALDDGRHSLAATHPSLCPAVHELGLDGLLGVVDEQTTVRRSAPRRWGADGG